MCVENGRQFKYEQRHTHMRWSVLDASIYLSCSSFFMFAHYHTRPISKLAQSEESGNIISVLFASLYVVDI